MVQSMKDNRWDGIEVNSDGVPQITPRPTKADVEAEEEE